MRILKCHVENFGKLSGEDFIFQEGINKVLKDNGYGKTTLSTFIKAMFYGLPCTTKKQIKENERKKYDPWQGGNYGGYLEFQIGNDLYKVERFFGKKETEDVFKVINLKTGKEENKFKSDTFGENIFDLDAEAFERSTYIPQKDLESGINEKISSKLINMVQGTNSLDSFENAVSKIKEKSLEIKKQRGNSGKLSEIETEIKETNLEIESLKKSLDGVDELNKDLLNEELIISDKQKEKEGISKQILELSEKQKIIANQRYIKEKKEEQIKLNEKYNKFNTILNGNTPKDEDVNSVIEKDDELRDCQTKLILIEKNETENEINELNKLFKNGLPTQEEIEENIHKAERISEINKNIGLLKNDKSNNENNKLKYINFIPAIIGVLLISLGCVFVKNIIVSVPCFVIGVLALLVFAFLYFRSYIENKLGDNKHSINIENFNEKQNELAKLRDDVESFLNHYNYKNTGNLIFDLYDLKAKSEQFYKLKLKAENLKTEKERLQNKITEINIYINNFFNNFNFMESELKVSDKVLIIKNAKKEIQECEKRLKELDAVLKDYKDVDIKETDLNAETDIITLQKQENDLQKEIDEHKERKLEIIKRIENINSMTEGLESLNARLLELKNVRDDLKNEHHILTTTIDYLTKANDNLTAKYRQPMQEGLNKYLHLVLDDKYEEFNLDTDLKVSFEKYGQSRNIDYLSKGYQSVVDLCIRFALIDVLFKKEKPFILLDDPFVNLDKDKLENALKLVEKTAQEYQIIYFACHNSRL